MKDTTSPPSDILVVGAGMAAHRFVESLLRDPGAAVRVTVIGDETHGPYDRSALVGVLSGRDAAELRLDRSVFRDDRVRLVRDDRVLHIDRSARAARTRARRTYPYDVLVLATGSFAARPVVSGGRLPGCFVLRTIEDAESVREFVDARSRSLGRPLRGVVIGGGLHGVETALALDEAGVGTTLVQYADRLLPALLDTDGAAVLQEGLEARGIAVRTRTRTTRLDADDSGAVTALEFQDGSFQRADVVVFTVGVRARDELARNAGLDVHPLGGVIVDDTCATSDPRILAIGEVANFDGRGIDAAPAARAMAEAAASQLCGGAERFVGHVDGVHHTVAGIDVVSFGESQPRTADRIEVVTERRRGAGVYRKVVLTDDARTLLGAVLVGDTSGHASLRRLVGVGPRGQLAAELCRATHEDDAPVCIHIGMSQRALLTALRGEGLLTFSGVGARFGREPGCERCTLAVARALTSLAGEPVPQHTPHRQREGEQPEEHVRADTTRAVVSPVSGGALTPEQLIGIGCIAQDLGLHPRIIRSRIELQGVGRSQLPVLRDRLSAAGLECRTPLLDSGMRISEEPLPLTEEHASAARRGSDEPHRGRGATGAIAWGERQRDGARHRCSPRRADSPA